jgi:hypothetical protein
VATVRRKADAAGPRPHREDDEGNEAEHHERTDHTSTVDGSDEGRAVKFVFDRMCRSVHQLTDSLVVRVGGSVAGAPKARAGDGSETAPVARARISAERER